jgi:hypothetical protein
MTCEACRAATATARHHIVTRGSGGPDEPWNILELCFSCHIGVFHGQGWRTACKMYPHLYARIVEARERMGRKV